MLNVENGLFQVVLYTLRVEIFFFVFYIRYVG